MNELRARSNAAVLRGKVRAARKLAQWSRRLDPDQPSVRPTEDGGIVLSLGRVGDVARITADNIQHREAR